MSDPMLYCGFSQSTGGLASRLLGGTIRELEDAGPQAPNHAFFLWRDPTLKQWLTMGANATGVTEIELSVFLRDRVIVRLFVPRFDLWAGLRVHVQDIGSKKYDYRGLFGMAFVELGKRRGRQSGNVLGSKEALFCSEWVSEVIRTAVEAIGVPWLMVKDNAIDPAFLANALAENPSWFAEVSPEKVLFDFALPAPAEEKVK